MTREEETTTMKKDTPQLGDVVEIDEARIKDHTWGGGSRFSGGHTASVFVRGTSCPDGFDHY
jgi:hypothetical protein